MFLGVHVYAVAATAIIGPKTAVTTVHAAAISGAQIVVANAWACSRNGVRRTAPNRSTGDADNWKLAMACGAQMNGRPTGHIKEEAKDDKNDGEDLGCVCACVSARKC